MTRALVAYDTKNGSTAEVAQAIADRLREDGIDAAIDAAREIRDVAEYEAFIVGAPIYSGVWLNGAHRMLRRLSTERPEARVAVFALGPRVNDSPENWARPRQQFEKALGKHPDLDPISTALFGGADPPKKDPRRDIRDWDAVDAWADELAALLGG